MKRRTFIKSSGITFLLLNLPEKGKAYPLDEKRLKILRKLCRVIVPSTEEIPVDAEKIHLPEKIDAFINSQLFFIKELMKTAIRFLDVLPYLRLRFKRFSEMEDDEAREFFISLRESRFVPLKGIYLAMKSVVNFMFYSSEEVWKYIGYEGPLL